VILGVIAPSTINMNNMHDAFYTPKNSSHDNATTTNIESKIKPSMHKGLIAKKKYYKIVLMASTKIDMGLQLHKI